MPICIDLCFVVVDVGCLCKAVGQSHTKPEKGPCCDEVFIAKFLFKRPLAVRININGM